jgi:dephospho-CoA kinase
MLKVGITGGIGSGKTVVCQVFNVLGIPVFNADAAARFLMENDHALIKDITALLGQDVYATGKLNRDKVSAIIFKEPEKLLQLNALVHPATIKYAQAWIENQSAPYVIKEAAIFFETGSNKDMDVMIGVSAPEKIRLSRAMSRGKLSLEQVEGIMAQQMNETEKMRRCDHVVVNDDVQAILPQVLLLHELLLAKYP